MDGTRTRADERSLAQARADSARSLDDRVEAGAASRGLAHDACNGVVAGAEITVTRVQTEAGATIERALVGDTVEQALHALGVGRLDLALDALRGLFAAVQQASM